MCVVEQSKLRQPAKIWLLLVFNRRDKAPACIAITLIAFKQVVGGRNSDLLSGDEYEDGSRKKQ